MLNDPNCYNEKGLNTLAKELEESKSNVAVTVIEQNPKRSSKIADNLNNSLVLNGDGLDQDLLEEANILSTDMILALTDDDETNIIISAIARKNNLEIFVGHIFLYHPVLSKLKKLMKKEKIDSIYLGWHRFGPFKEKLSLDIENPPNIQLYHAQNIKEHLEGTIRHPSLGESGLHTSWVMDKILNPLNN